MNNNHITRLEVKNFKKFDHLVVENIGQINLITGDNNVGKTSLLESVLMMNENSDVSLEYLHETLCYRSVHIHPKNIKSKSPLFPPDNYFDLLKNDKKQAIKFTWKRHSEEQSLSFKDYKIDDLFEHDFIKQKPDNYNVGRPNRWIKIYKNDTFEELQWMYIDDFKRDLKYGYWPFIQARPSYQGDINHFYGDIVGDEDGNSLVPKFKELDIKQKRKFITSLEAIVLDIEDTAIKNYYGTDILSIKVKSFDDYMPITFWGEGFNAYVRYLLEIVKNKDKFLLIDEMGDGVHWTRIKDVWVNIFNACIANNVQLFATSHSQECINAFVEAGEETDEIKDNLRLI